MFRSSRQNSRSDADIAVDIAPLIDVVFILLIFFLVTATFVEDTGLQIDRPKATEAEPLPAESLRIQLTERGAFYVDGQQLEVSELRERIQHFVEAAPRSSVIVIPDARAAAGALVDVLDIARGAGATPIAVAADSRGVR